MSRKPLVAGNWKLNHGRGATRALLTALGASIGHISSVDVVVAPVSVNLETASVTVRGSSIALAAQNLHPAERGAFTGEVSAAMLLEVGVSYVIVGHSERRQIFGETDAFVHDKVKAAIDAGLKPIVCVGETLDEREAGRTLQVVGGQIKAALGAIKDMSNVVVAYEPIWAIGTGKTATGDQAQDIHKAIRGLLAELHGASVASATRILYGGSVKPDNAAGLFERPDIDGALVGGASLKSDAFSKIVLAAKP